MTTYALKLFAKDNQSEWIYDKWYRYRALVIGAMSRLYDTGQQLSLD